MFESWFLAALHPNHPFLSAWLDRLLEMQLFPEIGDFAAQFSENGFTLGRFESPRGRLTYMRIHLAALWVLQSYWRRLCGAGGEDLFRRRRRPGDGELSGDEELSGML